MTTPVVIGWDVETPAIEPGNLTPPLVVATFAGGPPCPLSPVGLFVKDGGELLPEAPGQGPATVVGEDRYLAVDVHGNWKLALKGDAVLDFLVTLINAMVDGEIDALVAHNGSFDWGVLCNKWPWLLPILTNLMEAGRIRDTMVREKLICIRDDNFVVDSRRGNTSTRFGLDYLVMTYLRKDISPDKKDPTSWRLRYGELMDVPLNEWPQKALDYALEDAVYARLVFLKQGPEVVDEIPQTAAMWVLHLMACHGVYTEPEAVDNFHKVVLAEAQKADAAAKNAGFWKVNKCKNCEGTGKYAHPYDRPGGTCPICLGEPHELAVANGRYKSRAKHKPGKHMGRLKALITEAYHGHPPLTDKGNVKTDADTLAGSGHPLLKQYADGAAAQKLLNTYLPILERGIDTPITSWPNVLVRSGRTSWRNPNFQNPPQKGGFRECFIPRAGKVFASIDYTGLEMTTLAQVCLHFFGYSKMAEAINAGQDLHTLFASFMLQKEGNQWATYESCNAIRKDPEHEHYPLVKDRRQNAKVANFGFPGGLGVNALVDYAKGMGIHLTFNQADDLKKMWFAMWPEMNDYFGMISEASNMSIDGRFRITQLYSNRVRGGCSYTSGANSYFQGLAADGAKAAMWALYKACYLGELPDYLAAEECHLTGVRMWVFIHDEFLFEGSEERAHLWAPQASRIMVEEMKRYTPDVNQAAPPALMGRWYKNADPVYEGGKLVPWAPKESK